MPFGSPYLCLLLEFDLSEVASRDTLPERGHEEAAELACAATKLVPTAEVAARGRRVPLADLRAVQGLPFDDWSTNEAIPVKLDFCYAAAGATRLCIRVLTDLRHCDGVTALRLALHTLEVLEAEGSPAKLNAATFTRNPAFPASHFWLRNLVPMLVLVLLDYLLAPLRFLWKVARGQKVAPNCPEGVLWLYHNNEYDPGEILVFAPPGNLYRAFQEKVDSWRKEIGLSRGYFFLLNYAPNVCSGVVRRMSDLNSVDVKLRSVFGPPHHPHMGTDLWLTSTVLSRAMMFNNYGRHSHSFAARPTGFVWDWINFPSAMTAAFTISINGAFFCGIRGVEAFVERGRDLFAGSFGEGQMMTQITHHPKQGWHGRSPKKSASPPAQRAGSSGS